MQYTSDPEENDIWQPALATIIRYEGDIEMHGDCDDYAFLAREILRRQGHESAQVVRIPNHCNLRVDYRKKW